LDLAAVFTEGALTVAATSHPGDWVSADGQPAGVVYDDVSATTRLAGHDKVSIDLIGGLSAKTMEFDALVDPGDSDGKPGFYENTSATAGSFTDPSVSLDSALDVRLATYVDVAAVLTADQIVINSRASTDANTFQQDWRAAIDNAGAAAYRQDYSVGMTISF